jgi:anthranilate synthase component 2
VKVLIVDNYDSFTFNLYHYVMQFNSDVTVLKNDKVDLDSLEGFDKIILSPGPGLPYEHKNLNDIIKMTIHKPLLGVCLGHQAIAEYFGARLINLDDVNHGVTTEISIINEDYLFKNIPINTNVGLYHSWVVDRRDFPECFEITSVNKEGFISSFKHKELDFKGVQFHPESILTDCGLKMIENWIKN